MGWLKGFGRLLIVFGRLLLNQFGCKSLSAKLCRNEIVLERMDVWILGHEFGPIEHMGQRLYYPPIKIAHTLQGNCAHIMTGSAEHNSHRNLGYRVMAKLALHCLYADAIGLNQVSLLTFLHIPIPGYNLNTIKKTHFQPFNLHPYLDFEYAGVDLDHGSA
jgi:hypothetical protein